MTTADSITQLQQQQALLTQALSAMLQGEWCGAPPSLQAFTSALDPSLQIDCRAPILAKDQPIAPPFTWTADTVQPRQVNSWTCSVCATDWVCRATGKGWSDDVQASRNACQDAIGYPGNVNETYGLMDASGAQLMRVILQQTGLNTRHDWLSYDNAYAHYAISFGCMSGASWYHWVGVRGVDDQGNLWIANSAPGYDGVWDTLSRADFNRLGPFSCIWVDAVGG